MNLIDSSAPSGLWVYTLSSSLIVHNMIPWENYLCISTLILNCLQHTFVDGLLKLFAWPMKIHPDLISPRSRPMTSGESPHPSLSIGILLWKISADWSAGSCLTYSSVTISETWRPIRNCRTSPWWPHGRLSRNLVSYLLITRHLHQCRLTLVVYQWQVGTFEQYNGRFPNRTLYLQNVPTCHSSASPGEWLHFGFPCLADRIRNTKRGWSPGDSLIFSSCTFR